MEPIQVRAFAVPRAFDSIEAAVAHAMSHPLLPEARRDAERLEGAVLVDACWTLYEWIFRFDCDLSLCVWLEGTEIDWSLKPSGDVVVPDNVDRVGAAPVVLDWGCETIGLRKMDCSDLVAKRRGARFKDLFVNDHGFFVYFHGHLIIHITRAIRVVDGRAMLYVCEDD